MEKKRVILFPLPLQGCINPMLQLANILFSRGFSITIIHTRFNAPKSSDHPLFTFLEIPDGLSEPAQAQSGDALFQLMHLNEFCAKPFRECLDKLICDDSEEKISCLIDDSGWVFTRSVAESFNLPRFVLCTYKFTFFLGYLRVPQLRRQGFLPVPDSEAEDTVEEFAPLRKKDLSRFMGTSEILDPYLIKILETTKPASGIIVMSCEELDKDSLAKSNFNFPIFPIGPFHIHEDITPASSSSLLEQDKSCIPWLDKHETKSVLYVSFGSIVTITESQFLEIACGLRNSNLAFLWVVRPGSVHGREWIESLELLQRGFKESLEGRGKIVKWAPQLEVLAHRAIGGFLTHNGWNSTLESVCEGVSMICLPFIWDQMLNARVVSDVWRIGIHLEDRIERGEVERAVRRLMVGSEGEDIRKRIKVLRDEVKRAVKTGGSSSRSLDDLVDLILSF